jgi:cytochrome c-type biogenesis protein CcmH/NrfG
VRADVQPDVRVHHSKKCALMTMDIQTISQLQMALYCVFAALIYIGIILTMLLRSNTRVGRALEGTAQRQAFQSGAMELLGKGNYSKLKEVAMQREATHPGDAAAHYFLGMAHLQCGELVLAKACFEKAMRLDANWRKFCTNQLDEIVKRLDKSEPTLVDDEPQ